MTGIDGKRSVTSCSSSGMKNSTALVTNRTGPVVVRKIMSQPRLLIVTDTVINLNKNINEMKNLE